MKRMRTYFSVMLILLLLTPCYSMETKEDTSGALRPIQLEDMLAWKNIRSASVSNNGIWFAYNLSPNKGDSEVIIRQTKGIPYLKLDDYLKECAKKRMKKTETKKAKKGDKEK